MTEKRAPFENPIDLRAIIAELERDRAETQKLYAEASKMNAETFKLNAETFKLNSEGHKFNRDIWIVLLTGVLAVVAGVIARGPEILTALGWVKH
jgi:uncharacterized protein YegJ (DUF2314 family)